MTAVPQLRRRALPRLDPARLAGALIGSTALLGVVVMGAIVAVDSAFYRSIVVPVSEKKGYPYWLKGPLQLFEGDRLLAQPYGRLMIGMFGAYVVVVVAARYVPLPLIVGGIVILHVLFVLAPPVGSTDVTNYVSYARLGAVHGLSPYHFVPAAVPSDAGYHWVTWPDYRSPYGPLWTLGSYSIAPLGIPAAVWTIKAAMGAAALGCLGLVWHYARALGRAPGPALAFVGLSPLWFFWCVGGAHNDVLMVLLMLVAIGLVFFRRELGGGVAAVAAVGIKTPAVLLLPFLFIGSRDRRKLLIGVAAAGVVTVVATAIAFGDLDALTSFRSQTDFQTRRSFIGQFTLLQHDPLLTKTLQTPATIAFFVLAAAALVWAWRTRRWLEGFGWATAALLCTLVWEFPWYLVWLLPIAALVRGWTLRVAALFISLVLLWGYTPHMWLPWPDKDSSDVVIQKPHHEQHQR
jgi:alpha-1,6-mannosyltransferase